MIILTILLVILLIIVVLVALIFGGTFAFVYFRYDVNIFNILSDIDKLNKTVDVEKLTPNAFDESDYISIKNNAASSTSGFLTYDPDNGFSIDITKLPTSLNTYVSLSDKQVGAYADKEIKNNGDNQFKILNFMLTYELLQIEFENKEDLTTINTVVKIDLTDVKSKDNKGIDLLVYFIPDVLYISSFVDITKTGSNMEYNLTSNSLLFNNLTNKQTAELLDAVSAFTKEDFSAEYFNLEIGRAICSSLIGDETNEGLAYRLKNYGAKDFRFVTENDTNYFEVYR